ncbi:MAG: hypothetical protein K2M48_03950, partial [Clostridiales bacterium]|nr:hypothetical protein [Clostridiales bacterium]
AADNDYTGEKILEDKFFMSHTNQSDQQKLTFEQPPQYRDGVISFKYTSDWDPGKWYGMQVFYKNSTHTVGDTYKLNCKINIKSASLTHADGEEVLDKVKVTLNGNVIELNKGVNNVEVYYVYTAPLKSADGSSSFDLVMGWPDYESSPNGYFVQNADVEISDVSWTHDTPVTLKTPSFTYANNKIAVNDPNTEGVECYRALFYKNGVLAGASTLQNGAAFDTRTINKGTYTVKIQAVGKNAHYHDSAISESETTITVTEDASYTLTINGTISEALSMPGRWAYFAQDWITVNATHHKGVTTFTFSNNSGMFDALQLFYKNPENVAGKEYKMTVDMTLENNDEGGHITLSNANRYIRPGRNIVEVVYTEADGAASFAMIVAKWPNGGDINDGTIVINSCVWEEYSGTTSPLGTPSNVAITAEADTLSVTFNEVDHAYEGYEIGVFKDAASQTPTVTARADTGSATVNLEYLSSGTYVVK